MKRKLPAKCASCEKEVISKEQNTIVAIIDGTSYSLDSYDCVSMFKKFRCVYGPNLFDT
jgi:hypothetical protein